MHPYPHTYRVSATGEQSGSVALASPALADLQSAPPVEFDGPGNLWSPETLLCAAVADCFILTFRAVSRAARFEWVKLECRVEGTLDRVERVAQFTQFTNYVTLSVADAADEAKARELLERAEHACLISNSLRAVRKLEIDILKDRAG